MSERETEANSGQSVQDNVWEDQRHVVFAILALLGVALLQTVVGILALGQMFSIFTENTNLWVGRISLLQAVLLYGMALGTYFHRSFFAMGGTIISGIALLASIFALNFYLILISLACFILILRGYLTLRSIDARVAKEEQSDPMVDFYHRLIPVLVRVMAADGHLDRRERKKISQLCDRMRISKYEQQQLIRKALKYKQNPIEPLIDGLLAATTKVGYVDPHRKLLSSMLAVASADGIFVPEEISLLRQVGKQLEVPNNVIDAMLRQHQTKLEHIEPAIAREILSVGPNATTEQIRDAYLAFLQDFETEQYNDVGSTLKEHILQRKEVVERAFEVLQR